MSKRHSDRTPKPCKKLPTPPSIEDLRVDNVKRWRQIEQLHESTNASPIDEVSRHDDEGLSAHPLEIALEAEIELLANTPIPSVLESLSEAISLHETLVTHELDETLAQLVQSEFVLDRVIVRIRQHLHEMEQFMNEHEQIYESLQSRRCDNRKDDRRNRMNDDDALTRAREENQWLCEAMESFSAKMHEQHEQRSIPNKKAVNEWAYLSRSKNEKQLDSAGTTDVGAISPAMGPLTSKKRKRGSIHAGIHDDSSSTFNRAQSSDIRSPTINGKRNSDISLYRLLDDLIRRLMSNPDDPFIAINVDEKGPSTKKMIHSLIERGVIECHPDDSNLIQLVDLR